MVAFLAIALAGSYAVVDADTAAPIDGATLVVACPGADPVAAALLFDDGSTEPVSEPGCVGTFSAPGYRSREVHLDRTIGPPPHVVRLRPARPGPVVRRESVTLVDRACFERLGVERDGAAVTWWFERSDECGVGAPRRWEADAAESDWARVEAATMALRRPRRGARQVTASTRLDGRRRSFDLSTDGAPPAPRARADRGPRRARPRCRLGPRDLPPPAGRASASPLTTGRHRHLNPGCRMGSSPRDGPLPRPDCPCL